MKTINAPAIPAPNNDAVCADIEHQDVTEMHSGDALDALSCYRAVQARDARFDGEFFTAVRTTGIYCRPVCSAKTPAASSCTFYRSAAAAEQAGFRPCLRCRPELAPYALQENLAYAIWQKICAGALNEDKLEELSKQVGLSSRQLRRVLLQHFGVSPIELAQTQRLLLAKQLLTETSLPMTEVAFAAGFGSVRRFNTLFTERYQMPPSRLRKSTPQTDEGVEQFISLKLAYRPPYDWSGVLAYLASRRLLGIEIISNTHYMRTVSLAGHTGILIIGPPSVGSLGSANADYLTLQVSSSLLAVLQPLISRVRELCDLDANPMRIAEHLELDPHLAHVFSPGLRMPGAFERFELAIRCILGQQVSLMAGSTLCGRLIARFGTPMENTGWPELNAHFPTPECLASASIDELAEIGLPRTRAQTLQAFAQFAQLGGLETKPGLGLAEVLHQMQQLPGIGEWSANYIAMRALRFPDAFPAGDLVLQKAMALLNAHFGASAQGESATRLTAKQLARYAEKWKPWRAYAAQALWRSMGPLAKQR